MIPVFGKNERGESLKLLLNLSGFPPGEAVAEQRLMRCSLRSKRHTYDSNCSKTELYPRAYSLARHRLLEIADVHLSEMEHRCGKTCVYLRQSLKQVDKILHLSRSA